MFTFLFGFGLGAVAMWFVSRYVTEHGWTAFGAAILAGLAGGWDWVKGLF